MTTVTYQPPHTADVGRRVFDHVYEHFGNDPLVPSTCSQIKDYLEQLIPGSNWIVDRNVWHSGVYLDVQFVNENSKLLYTLKWL